MGHLLNEQQRAAFASEGYVAPVRVMSASDAGVYRLRVEAFIATVPDPARLRTNVHLD